MSVRLATVLGALVRDRSRILIEHDPILARQGNKALSTRATDQREAGLAGKFDTPGRKAGTGNKHRNAHPDRFDDHLRGQASGRVKDLVGGLYVMPKHKPGDLVDCVVSADILHIDQRSILLAQNAAVDRSGLKVEG